MARAVVLKTREEAEKLARKAAPYVAVAYGICPELSFLRPGNVFVVEDDYCWSKIDLCECLVSSKPYMPSGMSFALMRLGIMSVEKVVAVSGCRVVVKPFISIEFDGSVYEVILSGVSVSAECGDEYAGMYYEFSRSLTYKYAKTVACRCKFLDHDVVVPYPQYLVPATTGPLRGIEKIEVGDVVIGPEFIEEHMPGMIDAIPELDPECVVRLKSLLELYP